MEMYVNGERVNADEHVTWEEIRGMRNILLSHTDSYMISDRFALLSEERQTELLNYRQELRDLPQTYMNADGTGIDELEFPLELDWIIVD